MPRFKRKLIHWRAPRKRGSQRRGAAVVECALTAPLLVLAVFGAIEVGQYINITQSVCSASRMASRLAARQSTTTTTTVETEVKDFLLANSIPNNAVTVTVMNSSGTAITGTALGSIASGERISVKIDVQFSFMRNVSFLSSLNGAVNTATTSMRRE